MVKMVWGVDRVSIYLCAWHILKVCKLNRHLHSMEKIKDNGVPCAMLDNLHAIMYIPIEPCENIEAFMTRGRNMVIESFTQHLPNDSWIRYFWTYYFQLNTLINSQSITVVPPCYVYPKILILWIKVETPMIQTIPCGYCVFCCRFVDGGVLMSATFKLGHTSINRILPWGIENLVLFENKRALMLTNWLVSVEIHNNNCKTLHAHN